jgi:hypothetical protein
MHYLFNTKVNKTLVVDYSKPILVPAGMDTLEQIGGPDSGNIYIYNLKAKSTFVGSYSQHSLGFRAWKDAWTEAFPNTEKGNIIITIAKITFLQRKKLIIVIWTTQLNIKSC